jgi:hypothetical protein
MKKFIVLGCHPYHHQYCTVMDRNYTWFWDFATAFLRATESWDKKDYMRNTTAILADKELFALIKPIYGYILTLFTQTVSALRESELEGLEHSAFMRATHKRTGMMPIARGKTVHLGRRSELLGLLAVI